MNLIISGLVDIMSDFGAKMNALAEVIKSKNTDVTGKLTVQDMIDAVSGIAIKDSNVKFGYYTADGKFQALDLSGDTPVADGDPMDVDAVIFDTGRNTTI